MGGPVGIAVTIGPPIKEATDREFDRRFPTLAPYRGAAWDATPIGMTQAIANSPWNPLNPFGKWWGWAPWNKPNSPNSLNPPPNTSSPAIDPNGFWPVANPPESPIWFSVSLKVTFYNYNNAFGQNVTSQPFPATYASGRVYGIPLGWAATVSPPQNQGQGSRTTYVFLYLAPEGGLLVERSATSTTFQTAPTPGRYNSTYGSDVQPSYAPETAGSALAQNQTPVDLSPLNLAPESLWDIDAPPQYQPTDRPEVPPQNYPIRSPAPLADQIPRPSPSPRPQPSPEPTANPTAQPKPEPDPSAIPSPWPFPFAPPFPAPYLTPAPSPSQNPSTTTTTTTTTYGVPIKAPNTFPDGLRVPDILDEVFPFPSFDPGLPPADVDLCKDPCIKDMHDTSKGQKPTKIEYQQFKGCNTETGEAEFETVKIEVPASQAEFTKTLLNRMAELEGQQCTKTEAYAAIPESYQLKIQNTPPQLVVQYAEYKGDGKYGPPKYSITIPHYSKSFEQTTFSMFPSFVKGNYSAILVLPDNSKTIINAVDSEEAETAIEAIKLLIPQSLRSASIISLTTRRGKQLNQIPVVPRIANYYEAGNTDGKPTWRKYTETD